MTKPVVIPNIFATSPGGNTPASELDSDFSVGAAALNDIATYSNYFQDTGVTNAYVLALPAGLTATTGVALSFTFRAASSNTGASTINLFGAGPVPLLRPDGTPTQAGDIQTGRVLSANYDPLANEVFLSSLASIPSGSAGSVTYQSPLTGSVSTTVQKALQNFVSVKTDFGATGGGVTDDSAAFTAALAGMGAGVLYVPPGTYKVSTTFNLQADQYILGAGPGATIITSTSASANVFSMANSFCGVSQMIISCGGAAVAIIGGGNQYVSNIVTNNSSGFNPSAGLLVSACGEATISDCDFNNCVLGVDIAVTGSATAQNLSFKNVRCTSATNNGWSLTTATSSFIYNIALDNCASVTSTNYGMFVQGNGSGVIDGIFSNNFRSLGNGKDGINIQAAVQNVEFHGGIVSGNSASVSNTYYGIHIAANVNACAFNGIKVGPGMGYGDLQNTQIQVDTGTSSQIIIQGCNVGSTHTAISQNGTGTNNVIENCVGVIQKGFFAGTTDGSGHAVVTHNVGTPPKEVICVASNSSTSINIQPDSFNGTNFRITAFNTTNSAVFASTSIGFSWSISF
jgi:hypothetical protein